MTTELAGPTAPAQRIDALDVLRGLAILGILVVNIQSFSMPSAAYFDPHAWGDLTGFNFLVWLVSQVLFKGKFIAIFAMLFGAGIVLMAQRHAQRTTSPGPVHYRRMAWLLVIGLAHAHLLWYGDILVTYALCGMVVYLMWRLRPAWQLALGIVAYLVPIGWSVLFALAITYASPEFAQAISPGSEMELELAAYQGGWLEQMRERVPTSLEIQTFGFAFYFLWGAGGLMLIGMALYKWHILTGQASNWTYRQLLLLAVAVGLPLTLLGVLVAVPRGFAGASAWIAMAINDLAAPLVALGWISLVMLALPRATAVNPARQYLSAAEGSQPVGVEAPPVPPRDEAEPGSRGGAAARHRLSTPLAAVGRMALTNYLMQTIICTFIFYGHGLGYFGQVERTGQLAVVLLIWAAQLTWSPLWLRRYNYGPMEWLWRALTYRRWPAMRRRAAAAPA
ncbi:MAG: DUF418 domain-containing protein [Phycisphaeraceae bacterium]